MIDMRNGKLDQYITTDSDYFDSNIKAKLIDLNGLDTKNHIGAKPLLVFVPYNNNNFLSSNLDIFLD